MKEPIPLPRPKAPVLGKTDTQMLMDATGMERPEATDILNWLDSAGWVLRPKQ